MKVKELIELLKTLDQEKEIKTIVASGVECEEETSEDISVNHYDEFERPCGTFIINMLNDYSDNKDFYVIY